MDSILEGGSSEEAAVDRMVQSCARTSPEELVACDILAFDTDDDFGLENVAGACPQQITGHALIIGQSSGNLDALEHDLQSMGATVGRIENLAGLSRPIQELTGASVPANLILVSEGCCTEAEPRHLDQILALGAEERFALILIDENLDLDSCWGSWPLLGVIGAKSSAAEIWTVLEGQF